MSTDAEAARLSDGTVINIVRTAARCIEHGAFAKAHELHDQARLALGRSDALLPVEDNRARRIQQLRKEAGAHA